MASFGTDFHASIDEIAALVEGWCIRYPIVLTVFAFPRQVPIIHETLREVLARPDVGSLVFTECDANAAWQQAYDAAASGANPLILNIGRLTPNGLAQSFLSTMNATPTWRKFNLELKKLTTAGAMLVGGEGEPEFRPNPRFTAGAKALHASGIPLRQFENSTKFVYVPK